MLLAKILKFQPTYSTLTFHEFSKLKPGIICKMKWEDGAISLHILLKDYLRNGRLSSFEIVCLFFLFIALVFGRVMYQSS